MTAADFDWPLFLRQLNQREHAWNGVRVHYPRQDAVPFMPYSMQLFTGLLMDAIAAAPSWAAYDADGEAQALSFLDVGCGPGTKMLLAEQMFGMDAAGIDIVPEFIAEARDWCLQATVTDAFTYQAYDQYAIVLVNRPSSQQDDLEQLVCSRMRAGAVLIALNWRNKPSTWGWRPISEEWGEPVRGVYVKPDGVVHRSFSVRPDAVTGCCGQPQRSLPGGDSLTVDPGEVTCPGFTRPDDGGFLPSPPSLADAWNGEDDAPLDD